MQAFVQFVAGLIAALATAALAHLGLDVEPRPAQPREIQRVSDCPEPIPPAQAALAATRDC